MSHDTFATRSRKVSRLSLFCVSVGFIGLLTTFNLADQLLSLGTFEHLSYPVWLVVSTIGNPLCWVGAYGIYRLKRH